MVSVACVASFRFVSLETLALERKLESHSAFSPGVRGGISAGGDPGSNVRIAKFTGCLTITGVEVSVDRLPDEAARQLIQTRVSNPTNKVSRSIRRKGNVASAFHCPVKFVEEP
jgi:hypothetical protein